MRFGTSGRPRSAGTAAHLSAAPIPFGRLSRPEQRTQARRRGDRRPRLPDDAGLKHLKNQAERCSPAFAKATSRPVRWVRESHPDPPGAAQARRRPAGRRPRVRLPSWPKLRAHLEVVERSCARRTRRRESEDAAEEFLRLASLTYFERRSGALGRRRGRWLNARSSRARRCTRGRRRVTLEAARAARRRRGRARRPAPLGAALYLACSRSTGPTGARRRAPAARPRRRRRTRASSGRPAFPVQALTGAFGARGGRSAGRAPDALTLAASCWRRAPTPPTRRRPTTCTGPEDDAWLELLLEFGYGRGDGGPWHARLAPHIRRRARPPRTA